MHLKPQFDYVDTHFDEYLETLKSFLRYPTVSSQSVHQDDMRACIEFLKGYIQDMGLTVEIFETKGHPIVFAQSHQDPSKKTVLVYGHYDVQPEDPLELWDSDPFEPRVTDDYIYARGASDNKGMILAHLQAIKTLKHCGELPVNVKLIIEGEEEIGSEHLGPFVREHRSLIDADLVLISDNPMLAKGQPSICSSLRGLVVLDAELQVSDSDLHSGQNGGLAPNALHEAARLISRLMDDSGRVLVPGFYELPELTAQQQETLAALAFDQEAYKKRIGARYLIGDESSSPYQRLWYLPTIDVNGLWGGYRGEGSKTVIPSRANFKLSARLVAEQDPQLIQSLIIDYLHQQVAGRYRLTIRSLHNGAAFQTSPDNPGIAAALKALEYVHGVKAICQGEGGSIPIVAQFKAQGLESVLIGMNQLDDGLHAPNERFALADYKAGILSSMAFMTCYANMTCDAED